MSDASFLCSDAELMEFREATLEGLNRWALTLARGEVDKALAEAERLTARLPEHERKILLARAAAQAEAGLAQFEKKLHALIEFATSPRGPAEFMQ